MIKSFTKIALVATFGLALALTFSCSSDEGGNSQTDTSVRKEKISGVSQKGPFGEGSTVTLYELNTSMQKTGTTFSGTTDSEGNFQIKIDTVLVSPYVILEVEGKYKNEVDDGKESDKPITLSVIADVRNKDKVNINALTNFEYKRVLELLGERKTFEEAKAIAQKESLKKFGIESASKNSEDMLLSDKELFTISTVLGIYADNTSELILFLAEIERVNAKVENSTLDDDDIESLFNKAKDYIASLYPTAAAYLPTFDTFKNYIDKIKVGGISDWDGGCEVDALMIYYCMEFKGISGEFACDMMRAYQPTLEAMGSFNAVKSCPKPENDRYCFEGSACTNEEFTPPESCGGTSGYSRKACESNPKVESIMFVRSMLPF